MRSSRVNTSFIGVLSAEAQNWRRKKNVHAGGNIAVHVDVGVLRERTSWSAPCQFKSSKRCAMFYENDPRFISEFRHGQYEAWIFCSSSALLKLLETMAQRVTEPSGAISSLSTILRYPCPGPAWRCDCRWGLSAPCCAGQGTLHTAGAARAQSGAARAARKPDRSRILSDWAGAARAGRR